MPKAYKPAHADNRMRGEGDVLKARADYARSHNANLRLLLRSRFEWMNQYVGPDSLGADIGCGAGFSKEFIRCRKLLLTDFTLHDYLDIQGVDALHLPFARNSLDFIIASNMIHHVPHPMGFLNEARRVLRTGGFLLMHEVHASWLFCSVLRMMRHEGYSFDVDVFDDNSICTDPNDLWAGNNAIPRLLFDDHEAFLRAQPGWEILRDEVVECLMFLNSGGVTAKTIYVPLPLAILKGLGIADEILSKIAPHIFSLGRRLALKSL
jgi:SAM-dependent methyltransferase